MNYSNLIGKQISEVKQVACNVIVLVMSDGSVFEIGTECVFATQFGEIYAPTIEERSDEEINECLIDRD